MDEHEEKALSFFDIGFQYLDLCQKVALEISRAGNVWFMVQDGADFEKLDKEYDEATYWSDHKLAIPLLFNLYHGIELIIKGLLSLSKAEPKNHKLSALLAEAKKEHGETEFICHIEKYLIKEKLPEILNVFFDGSGIDVDEWYQALKYPESTKGKKYQHFPLKYQEEEGALFCAELHENVSLLRVSFVKYIRSNYPKLA